MRPTRSSGRDLRAVRRPAVGLVTFDTTPNYSTTQPDAPVAVEREQAPDLESLKKDELVALAQQRGLDSSGTKDEIRARLEAPQ